MLVSTMRDDYLTGGRITLAEPQPCQHADCVLAAGSNKAGTIAFWT